MKRFALLLILSCAALGANATDSTSTEGIDELILKQLIKIKAIQDSTYEQRMRAFENKDKVSTETEVISPSEYYVLSKIKSNTDKNFNLDNWNLYGLIALFVSVISAVISYYALKAQNDTKDNTSNVPIEVQQARLADVPRHFYRNLVCTVSIISKFIQESNGKSGKRLAYPSEANLLKLFVPEDDYFLQINRKSKSYDDMLNSNLRLLFRNYNIEVQVAAEHLSRKHLTDDSLMQDFDNLLFKPFFLCRMTYKYEKLLDIAPKNKDYNIAYRIILSHFVNLKNNLSYLCRSNVDGYINHISDSSNFITNVIDKRGAIRRSMGTLNTLIIERDSFINDCKDSELRNFIKDLSSNKKCFINWYASYKSFNDSLAVLSAEELYEILLPYLLYINKESWDFKTLFYYIITVDAAIEIDRIGMINY